jgi:hypothetical protein
VVQVVGDNTSALDAVLECDTERLALLAEEAELMEALNSGGGGGGGGGAAGPEAAAAGERPQQGAAPPAPAAASDAALTQRLEAVSKRLHDIGGRRAAAPACGACSGRVAGHAGCRRPLDCLQLFLLHTTTHASPTPRLASPPHPPAPADAYGAKARAAAILAGLSFTPDMQVAERRLLSRRFHPQQRGAWPQQQAS